MKLQCCYGKFPSVPKWRPGFENVTDYERNLSPMILIANLSKFKSFPPPRDSGNYLILNKTRVKLFSNFTRHHLIARTYFMARTNNAKSPLPSSMRGFVKRDRTSAAEISRSNQTKGGLR